MWDYTEKVRELFKNPLNVGEIKNPDAVGNVGSIVCGDALKLTLRIDSKTEVIKDAKFKTFGCASAIASSSALTEIIKGKTIAAAEKITNKDIAKYLGGLPEEKMHCSVMGVEALEAAIANYRGKTLEKKEVGKERVVCECFGVTDARLIKAIGQNQLKTIQEVSNYTKAGAGCGKCRPEIEKILKEYWKKEATKGQSATLETKKKLTNLERISLIQEVIEKQVKPGLQSDGGDLELVDIDRNKVYVKFLGACLGCPSSGITLQGFVETKLKELVAPEMQVYEVRK